MLRAKGETLWTLNWLPIGGFVRMEGEDGDAADDPRSFSAQKLRVKLAILVNGVVMNIILAFAIFFVIALAAHAGARPEDPDRRAGLARRGAPASSPATRSGTVARGGVRSLRRTDRSVDALRDHAGETVALTVRHADGTEETITATLRPKAEISPTRGAARHRAPEPTTYDYATHDSRRPRHPWRRTTSSAGAASS